MQTISFLLFRLLAFVVKNHLKREKNSKKKFIFSLVPPPPPPDTPRIRMKIFARIRIRKKKMRIRNPDLNINLPYIYRENGRDKQEKNLVHDSYSSQNQRHSGLVRSRTTASDMRNNGGADLGRHQTTPPGTHGSRSSGLHNGHQRSQASRQQRTPPSSNGSGGGRTNSSGNGPSRSQVMAGTGKRHRPLSYLLLESLPFKSR